MARSTRRISKLKTPQEEWNEDVFNYIGYERERSSLSNSMEALLKHSQASSVIICGDRGSGKSTLVDYCLDAFTCGESSRDYQHLDLVVFRFDGNLHGKNDLATIRLIGGKLNQYLDKNRRIELEDDEEDEDENEHDFSNKVANSIPKVIAQFRYLIDNRPNFRSIIVLDNIEIFCRRQQTLLYNLLDVTQHSRCLLLVGLTRRLDFVDLLEKRVRSRLSQRIIQLVSPFQDLESFRNYCVFLAKTTHIGNQTLWSQIPAEKHADFYAQVEKCFHTNRNFNAIRQMVQLHSFAPSKKLASSVFLDKDPKIVSTFNLTQNELTLLLVAARHVKIMKKEAFTCRQLLAWSLVSAKHLKNLEMPHVIKAVYKMMQLDLMIVALGQASRRGQYSITPWVSLVLNISDFQLEEMLTGLGNKVPNYLRQLLA